MVFLQKGAKGALVEKIVNVEIHDQHSVPLPRGDHGHGGFPCSFPVDVGTLGHEFHCF